MTVLDLEQKYSYQKVILVQIHFLTKKYFLKWGF